MKKNLTAHYAVIQFFYSAVYSGSISFATTYLLGRGLPPGLAGTLLAASGLLACLTQPVLASRADQAKTFLLPRLMLLLSGLSLLCFTLQLIPTLPLLTASILYVVGVWCGDTMAPLVNALCMAYNEADFSINYGAGRGIGSAASATASLALGFIIAKLGSSWMFVLFIAFEIVCMISIASLPKLQKAPGMKQAKANSCTIPEFFARYRWFCFSLLGIGFLGMFHCMTENYMIAIMERLGGDSSHVGTALFIACISGAPVIFFFQSFRRRFKDTTLLKIAALSFLVKSLLFFFARSIWAIYLIQLLQTTSYAFLGPAQVYYAGSKVALGDMVKGQAFLTAIYSLGCSGGSFLGGQLLHFGVDAMLIAGIGTAIVGTVILFLTVGKSDI